MIEKHLRTLFPVPHGTSISSFCASDQTFRLSAASRNLRICWHWPTFPSTQQGPPETLLSVSLCRKAFPALQGHQRCGWNAVIICFWVLLTYLDNYMWTKMGCFLPSFFSLSLGTPMNSLRYELRGGVGATPGCGMAGRTDLLCPPAMGGLDSRCNIFILQSTNPGSPYFYSGPTEFGPKCLGF